MVHHVFFDFVEAMRFEYFVWPFEGDLQKLQEDFSANQATLSDKMREKTLVSNFWGFFFNRVDFWVKGWKLVKIIEGWFLFFYVFEHEGVIVMFFLNFMDYIFSASKGIKAKLSARNNYFES